jgi:hypothetical protein
MPAWGLLNRRIDSTFRFPAGSKLSQLFETEFIMACTVIGFYDAYFRAENALNDLLSRGFPRHKVYLGPIEDTPSGRAVTLRELDQSDDQSVNRLTLPGFFRALFSRQDSDGDIYLEAVRRGYYMLMANADNDQEADQAMDVMARHHPVNIDKRSSRWRSQGWSGFDPAAAAMTEDETATERSAYTEEKPSMPIQEVQGAPVTGRAAGPSIQTPIPRNEAQRLGIRLFQRGF